MRLLRQPWTSDLTETLISRIFEFYILEHNPGVNIDFVGRDFPLPGEVKRSGMSHRASYLTGFLALDPIRFLELQADINSLVGLQIDNNHGSARGKMGMKELFLSETFRREFSAYKIGTKDFSTHRFLSDVGIDSTYIGCVSFLLGSLNLSRYTSNLVIENLLIDLNDEVLTTIIGKYFLNESYKIHTTKVSEICGEGKKNELIDSLISLLVSSKVVITSNINIALPALSLGSRVILITNLDPELIPFSEFIRVVRVDELSEKLNYARLSDLTTCVSLTEILKRQMIIRDFIDDTLQSEKKPTMGVRTFDYKNQVLAEVVSALLSKIEVLEGVEEQFRTVLESRSWKATAPLRVIVETRRRLRGLE